MNIGNKIKELRKSRGITQEQLAESIGVSFQAVSKWETGIALPDITLSPVLASYFGVSMDTLFDFSLAEIEKDARSIAKKSVKYREENRDEGRKIIEEGLKKYPGNDTLLNNLLYLLNDTEETISIASNLIGKTNSAEVKYDALRFLAYAYKDKGDLESAKAAIEQIPEIYFTKLTEAAFVLEGKPKFEAAEKQKWISFENMLQMMEKLAEFYESEGNPEKAAAEREKALKLISVMEHKAFDIYAEYFKEKLR